MHIKVTRLYDSWFGTATSEDNGLLHWLMSLCSIMLGQYDWKMTYRLVLNIERKKFNTKLWYIFSSGWFWRWIGNPCSIITLISFFWHKRLRMLLVLRIQSYHYCLRYCFGVIFPCFSKSHWKHWTEYTNSIKFTRPDDAAWT